MIMLWNSNELLRSNYTLRSLFRSFSNAITIKSSFGVSISFWRHVNDHHWVFFTVKWSKDKLILAVLQLRRFCTLWSKCKKCRRSWQICVIDFVNYKLSNGREPNSERRINLYLEISLEKYCSKLRTLMTIPKPTNCGHLRHKNVIFKICDGIL